MGLTLTENGATTANDYQAECHTPEYHIGIDLIKPCQNPVRMRYSGVWHSAGR